MKIETLDLDFQGLAQTIAGYLISGSEGPVLVETGPASTLEALLARLDARGLKPQDIRHVLVTHIHLDHAGAAGWWARQGAQVYVHHVGAPHLIDPSKLLSSAGRIYGEHMDILWGETLSAPADRVTPLYDNDVVAIGNLRFTALDTPGHASHHFVYKLADENEPGITVAFSGDAAGIHIPGPAFVDLPAPPPEFQLEQWQQTIDRLLQEDFAAIYPTHFGRLEAWRPHLQALATGMLEAAELVRDLMAEGLERDEILSRYLDWHRQRAEAAGIDATGFQRYELANPHFMSVDGIMRYWRKLARPA